MELRTVLAAGSYAVPARRTSVTVKVTEPRFREVVAVKVANPDALVTGVTDESALIPDHEPATVAPATGRPLASTTFTDTDAVNGPLRREREMDKEILDR